MRGIWKKTIVIAGVIFGLSSGISYAVPTVPHELLTNGDFASGALSPWTKASVAVGTTDPNVKTLLDSEITLMDSVDNAPNSIVDAGGHHVHGPVYVRSGSSDNYFVRGGIPSNETGTPQLTGYRVIQSNDFTIPTHTINTDVSFYWRLMTWDSSANDTTWAVIRKSDDSYVAQPCGQKGGLDRGGLQDTGWKNCSKTYDTTILTPGETYFLRMTLFTNNDTSYPSWGYADSVSVKANVVPEPATILLLGGALVGMGLLKGRRKNS
ncbi:MAG: PEP-CTERM sorting domain-containing protein [Nitrospirae bacterium]|nr:PEP-CTERM sorting domain-containing protein [Nitrospirota bacterium]